MTSLAEQNEKLNAICDKLDDIKINMAEVTTKVGNNENNIIRLQSWKSFYAILTPLLTAIISALGMYIITK